MKVVTRSINGKTVKLKFDPYEYTEESISQVMDLIRANLTQDLLLPDHLKMNQDNPMYGHCNHASQALLCLMDTDKLVQMVGGKHVWLQDGDKIYDVTVDQYLSIGVKPPYNFGVEEPIRRYHYKTFMLIERILGDKCDKEVSCAS